MKQKITALALAALACIAASAPASANLVLQSPLDLTGQGIGAAFTVLTLQEGANSTESGGVLFNGSVFGSASTGASQSRTFTFGDLGITSANQFGLIVNLSEPLSESPPSVTTALSNLTTPSFASLANGITLNVYSSTGTLLEQHVSAAGQTLVQQAAGIGGSGLLFALTSEEAAQLNATMLANLGTEVFTVGATFANAQGGNDVLQAIRLDKPVAAIPEPETYALMLAGLGLVGWIGRRKKAA